MSTALASAERDTLLRAIRIEARNGAIYDALASVFRGFDESITAVFLEMAEEERSHQARLEARHEERFGAISGGSEPEGPGEVVERADMEDSEAFLFDSMTAEQALESGLRAELEARHFYEREAGRASDSGLKKVYGELAAFEGEHAARLQAKLTQLRDGSASR